MKVDWEQKQRNIDRRNTENAEILNDAEVSDILEYITKCRHAIHSTNDLFLSESANYKELSSFIETINERLQANNLPEINFGLYSDDITADYEYYDFGLWETYEEALENFLQQKEQINSAIEKWLLEFDRLHGTNYCPTGWDRLR